MPLSAQERYVLKCLANGVVATLDDDGSGYPDNPSLANATGTVDETQFTYSTLYKLVELGYAFEDMSPAHRRVYTSTDSGHEHAALIERGDA